MRFLSLLLSLLLVTPAYADSPVIWGPGGYAKNLTTNGISLSNGEVLKGQVFNNAITGGDFENPTVSSNWGTYLDSDSVTFTDAGDTVTLNNHGLANGDTVAFTTITSTTGISTNTIYYVVGATTNTFQVASSSGGSALPLTTNGSGTMVRGKPVDATGGTASNLTAAARDTTSGNLINGVGVGKFAKAAAVAMGSGWNYAFTVPANWSGRNSLVSLTFNYFFSASVSQDVRIYIYDVTNSALITPSFITCGGGSTPTLTVTTSVCAAKLSFVSTGATSYRLAIHNADTGTSAYNLFLDDLTVTDWRAQPGVNSTAPVSYTPTISGVGTATSVNIEYKRNATRLKVGGQFTTGTTAASQAQFTLPTGYTIKTPGSATEIVGKWWTHINTATSMKNGSIIAANGNAYVTFGSDDYTNGQYPDSSLNGSSLWNSSTVIFVEFEVEANEIQGDTAFGENQVTYACNTGGEGSAANTAYSNSTYFSQDPAGCSIQSYGSQTTGSASTDYTVRFGRSRQTTDSVVIEVNDGNGWGPAAQKLPAVYQKTAKYGIDMALSSTLTDIVVKFGNGGYASNGTNYGDAGAAWSGITSWKWRAKLFSGGSPVPFGLATSSVPGLYQAGSVPGVTSGNASATGNIGEVVSGSGSNVSINTSSMTTIATATMTTGKWLCSAQVNIDNQPTQDGTTCDIYTKGATTSTQGVDRLVFRHAAGKGDWGSTVPKIIDVSSGDSDKTFIIKCQSVTATGAAYGQAYCSRFN